MRQVAPGVRGAAALARQAGRVRVQTVTTAAAIVVPHWPRACMATAFAGERGTAYGTAETPQNLEEEFE